MAILGAQNTLLREKHGGSGGSYHLRKAQVPYNSDFTPENSDLKPNNTYF
ncbi:hypothetical protein LCGC14_2759530 [marine sediment metagenome]|uniref:Uncharacterized protein n=1 Tax=marine sediment metagenome TaxID=412755 RepID=A0A0F8YZD5_9ZZZZ